MKKRILVPGPRKTSKRWSKGKTLEKFRTWNARSLMRKKLHHYFKRVLYRRDTSSLFSPPFFGFSSSHQISLSCMEHTASSYGLICLISMGCIGLMFLGLMLFVSSIQTTSLNLVLDYCWIFEYFIYHWNYYLLFKKNERMKNLVSVSQISNFGRCNLFGPSDVKIIYDITNFQGDILFTKNR